MFYELNGTRLKITAESTDEWSGVAFATHTDNVNGIPVVRCGDVKKGRKTVALCVRYDNKPELQALVAKWMTAIATAKTDKASAAAAELEAIRTGATAITVHYHDGEYLSGYTCHGQAARLLAEIGAGEEVSGWGVHVSSDLVSALGESFTFQQAVEFCQPRIDAAAAKKQAAEDRDTETESRIEARCEELIASGETLATDNQLQVISRAGSKWFDLFDGAAGYGVYGPSEEELRTMTIDKASRLVGMICDARKAGV